MGKTSWFLHLIVFAVGASAWAQETITLPQESADWSSEKKSPISATVGTAYFDMQGTRPAINNLYSFGHMSNWTQTLEFDYAVNRDWTASVVGQELDNYTEIRTARGAFTDRTAGFGDSTAAGSRSWNLVPEVTVFVSAGVSLPTGAFDLPNRNLPRIHDIYPMQLGSGTFDGVFVGGPTWTHGPIDSGLRISSTIHTGVNSLGYRLGDIYRADNWLAYHWGWFSTRLEGDYTVKGPMAGGDPTLGRTMWTESFYHPQSSFTLSAAVRFDRKLLSTINASAEVGVPFAQNSYNTDSVVISTRYFAFASINGTF